MFPPLGNMLRMLEVFRFSGAKSFCLNLENFFLSDHHSLPVWFLLSINLTINIGKPEYILPYPVTAKKVSEICLVNQRWWFFHCDDVMSHRKEMFLTLRLWWTINILFLNPSNYFCVTLDSQHWLIIRFARERLAGAAATDRRKGDLNTFLSQKILHPLVMASINKYLYFDVFLYISRK